MESTNHKGAELNNVRETWDQNERLKANDNSGDTEGTAANESLPATDLDKIVQQEATEYDNENKENRILPGDRATVNDDETPE